MLVRFYSYQFVSAYTPAMKDDRLIALTDWCSEQLSDDSGPLQPLENEASTRRFFRIEAPSKRASCIAMDTPPETENNNQFVRLSEVFRRNGVPVPEVYAADFKRGFLLVEDFGDRLFFSEYLHTDRKALIAHAISLLEKIQTVRSPDIPPYEESRYRMELEIFREWTCGSLLHINDAPIAEATDHIVDKIVKQPRAVVHRDFHCKNLLSLKDGSGKSPTRLHGCHVGLVDFQDALLGAFTYDLASYAYDCYWEFSEQEIDSCIDLVWSNLTQSKREEYGELQGFRSMVEIVALQRMLKAVGIFCRLQLQRNRASHLQYVCPVIGRAAKLALKHEATAAVGSWLQQTVTSALKTRLSEFGVS